MNKDTYMLEIIAKAREWQKTKSITTSSEVCKMLNDLADKNLAEIGLDGIGTRLRGIVKELDDIENTLDSQWNGYSREWTSARVRKTSESNYQK